MEEVKRIPLLLLGLILLVILKVFVFSARETPQESAPGATESSPIEIKTSSAPPGSPAKTPRPESLDELLEELSLKPGNVLKSESGEVQSLLDLEIPLNTPLPQSALALAQKFALFLGVDSRALRPHSGEAVQSAAQQSFDFEQNFEGYEVFEGGLQLLMRKRDNSVYMVNNSLKVVESPQLEIKVSRDQAKETLDRYFSRQRGLVESAATHPTLWADEKPHELAWIFIVDLNIPKPDRFQVLVGAFSGKILLKRRLLTH